MTRPTIKIAILGATGYTGEELVRLLSAHPHAEIVILGANQSAGKKWGEISPVGPQYKDLVIGKTDVGACLASSDVVFACLPHGHSAPTVKQLYDAGHPVIDLAADFRLKDLTIYENYYGKHPHPELLSQACYGLPELWRDQIKQSKFVANPGCYPTSISLALAPLLKAQLIDTESIICDSKSGMSGAGRQTVEEIYQKEMPENFKAYKVIGHRHTPEIEQNLSILAENKIFVSFTPHLLPVHRGILSTVYAQAFKKISREELNQVYQKFYENEFFVKVLSDESPNLKAVQLSNQCHISVHINPNNNMITVLSAIDNLTKGASGQAVQNMNLMFGFAENLALS